MNTNNNHGNTKFITCVHIPLISIFINNNQKQLHILNYLFFLLFFKADKVNMPHVLLS